MRREDSFAMLAGRALNTKIVLRLTSARLGASHVGSSVHNRCVIRAQSVVHHA